MKVLIVKLSSLGDVVHTLPALQDLRRAVSGVQIDWVVERGFADLVARADGVHQVIPCDLRQWRRAPLAASTWRGAAQFREALRAQAYDRVIDLQGLTKSALVAWLARLAPQGRRVGLAHRTDGSSFEAPARWVAHDAIDTPRHIHAVDRSRFVCARAFGYPSGDPPVYGLRARPDRAAPGSGTGSPGAPEVVLVHGSSRADKLWPEPLWQALGQTLIDRGWRIGLPHGSADEAARAQRLAQALGPRAQVWPRLDLGALVDRLALTQGVIGVDSGLSHLATALDLPHVQIYNHDTAWRTGPVARPRQRSVEARPHPPVAPVLAAWDEVTAA